MTSTQRPDPLSLAVEAGQLQSKGQLVEAIELYRRALTLDPHHAEIHNNLGTALQGVQRFEEAKQAYQRAIQLKPSFVEAHNNLGNALKGLGDNTGALAAYRQAAQLNPSFAAAYFNIGNVLQSLDQLDEAASAFRRAIQVRPKYPKAENNLGNVLKAQGKLTEAAEAYRRASAMQPKYANAEYNLGTVLQQLGRLDDAIAAYRRALEAEPLKGEALRNLAAALHGLGRSAEAAAVYKQALVKEPNNAQAENNLGAALADLGQMSDAIAAYQRAIALKPDFIEAYSNIGNVFKDTGRLDEAIESYEKAIKLAPNFFAAHSNLVFCEQYRPGATIERLAEVHAEWNRRHLQPLREQWKPFDLDRNPERPLRIGLVSSDLGHHPIGYLVVNIIESIDRQRATVHCYSNRIRKDDMTARLERAASSWCDCATLNDQELADRIRADRIDILLDLSGHTAGNRLLTFARKPAPIQASWMGYVGPTGVEAIEHFIADRQLVPDDHVSRYREHPIRLPFVSCCYELPVGAPDVGPLPARQRGHVTFGSFNNPAKITPYVVALWARILARVPQSRLIMKFRGLDDPGAARRYRDLFAAAGVDPQRVELQGVSPYAQMLELYNSTIDIGLDPFPYTGGTTSLIASWMGVPIVTLPGETLASRQTTCILRAIGVDETIATSPEDYVDRAVHLAEDLPALESLRRGLRSRFRASRLVDGPALARDLITELRQVWQDWCAKGTS